MSRLREAHRAIYEAYQAKQAQPDIKVVKSSDRYKSKLEADYARTYLDPLVYSGAVRSYYFESLRFRLGEGAQFTPDFFIVWADEVMGVDEVKGPFCREAALVRFKVAKSMYPCFRWRMMVRKAGSWMEKSF